MAGKWLGGDNNFVRAGLTAIQYVPLPHSFYFGLNLQGSASFGDAPFYAQPYVSLRGVPVMRYQGEEVLSLEGELRWQFWKRFSILGFVGAGNAWNDFEKLDNSQGVVSGWRRIPLRTRSKIRHPHGRRPGIQPRHDRFLRASR
ncbi:MAG: hypothetical protein WDO74_00805 [Pseudomonadota bacterium]